MSAVLSSSNSFNAHLVLAAGVSVSINAPTMAELATVVGKLQPTEAANDAGRAPAATTGKAPKPAATPAPSPEPQGNGSASTGTQASAQGAAAGSAATGDGEKRPTYDDVRERVLKLAKVSRETATGALGKFGVDHANKLKLEDYASFIAHADELLKAGAA